MELKYRKIHVQVTFAGLLIVLNGIEILDELMNGKLVLAFNRTKWN